MPRSTPRNSLGLHVIGAGLPRTSTSSLQALQILGYNPCYHTITDSLPNASNDGTLWLRAMKENDKAKRQKILKELVKGYVAIVDGPGCFFVEDWIEMFPDAKVVLGLRMSPQAWLTSVNATIGNVFGKGLMYYLTYFVPEAHQGFMLNSVWDAQTKAKIGVGARSTEFYDFHNEKIRRAVLRDMWLEFQAADRWDPLCKFLGKEKPVGGYPHRNDAKAANQIIKSFAIWGVGAWVAVGLSGWGLVYGVQRLLGSFL